MKATQSFLSHLRWISTSPAAPRCASQRSIGDKFGHRCYSTIKKASPSPSKPPASKTFPSRAIPSKVSLAKSSPPKINLPKKPTKPVVVQPAAKYTPSPSWKPTAQRAAPENVLIYHAGTGRIVFLGMLRTATIFICGVSTVIIAPAFFADEFPWYLAPLIVVGGALPLAFVGYTTAPFVNNIYIHLPIFARKSREAALEYVKNLPPTATLSIRTMKITTIPRTTEVRISDLVSDKAFLRPISFTNQNSQGFNTLKQFYATPTSKTARATPKFYPELWEHVFAQIRTQRAK